MNNTERRDDPPYDGLGRDAREAVPERAWLAVVSAEHAAIGAQQGWIQLNHGKRNNLKRLHRGDGFVFILAQAALG